MDTSVCPSGNDINVCKHGNSSCPGDCFIKPDMAILSILSCCDATVYEYE